eukprot:403359482
MESGKPPMYIDPDLYIKISGEGDLENHYKCIICSGVVFDPVECKSCQNLYCKQCIDKSRYKCPNKCDNAQFQTIHRLLRNVLNKMTFRCQNYPRCFVQLRYDQYKQHYDKCIIKSLSSLFEELQEENRALKGKSVNQEKKLEEIEKRMADLELFCKESVSNSSINDNFQQEEEEKLEKEQTDNSCDLDGRDIDSQRSRGGFEGRERPMPERPMRGFYRGQVVLEGEEINEIKDAIRVKERISVKVVHKKNLVEIHFLEVFGTQQIEVVQVESIMRMFVCLGILHYCKAI